MANRKRYEVTCDTEWRNLVRLDAMQFQYRKRYEVTCDKIGVLFLDLEAF